MMLDRKYERMMDKKERRRFEKEKLSKMSLKEKIEYLWMYYKIWLAVPAAVIVAVYTGVQMYHGMNEEIMLNVTIINGKNMERTAFGEEIRKLLGAEKKNETVQLNANLTAAGDYNSKIGLSTLIGAEAVDVLVCPEELYEEYAEIGGFVNLEELLPEEIQDGGKVHGDAVILENSEYLEENVGTLYDTVYVCVVNNAKHKENAARFLQMLCEKQ